MEVLSDLWKKHNGDNYLFLFDKHKENTNLDVSYEEIILMRNFQITKLIIPNRLRSGVISGATIEEMFCA